MKIRYEVSMDDMLAFYSYFYANSKMVRNQRIAVLVIVSASFFVAAIMFDFGFSNYQKVLFPIVASVVFAVFFSARHKHTLKRCSQKLLEETGTDGILGQHELELFQDRLTERTEFNETSHFWVKFDRIIESEEHFFLFATPTQAHVIPKHGVLSGDLDRFIDQARKTLNAASQTPDE